MTSDLPSSATRPLPLLTPQALCAQLSISYRTYSRIVRAGWPFVPVLTARRYEVAEVVDWLRAKSAVQRGQAKVRAVRMPLLRPQDDQLVRQLKLLANRGRR
jgi:hypothetical protein